MISDESASTSGLGLPIRWTLLPLALILLLSACGASAEQVSATATEAQAATELAQLRASATVARARLSITLDFVGTRVKQANDASAFLRSNLVALGTQSLYIDAQLETIQRGNLALPAANASERRSNPATPGGDTKPIVKATAPVIVTPGSRARLSELTMAAGVRGDDCAADINPVFTPASARIYVVAKAHKIAADEELSSIWRFNGGEVARFRFKPDFAIDGSCIWFYIEPSDAPFTAGPWSVELRHEGKALASPLAFEIVAG